MSDLSADEQFDAWFPPHDKAVSSDWGKEAWRVWARGQRAIMEASENVQQVSYLLYTIAGFEPAKTKAWLSGCHALLTLSDEDMDLIKDALTRAQADRVKGGLTFVSPYSFINYIAALKSERVLKARAARVVEYAPDEIEESEVVYYG